MTVRRVSVRRLLIRVLSHVAARMGLPKSSTRAGAFVGLAVLAASQAPAGAQFLCPAVGSDIDCGAIITVSNTTADVSLTGQGPYDGQDDTLVGVVNKSSNPLYSLDLSSSGPIFSFDGDGIANDTYGLPGNRLDASRYGGPNAYFTNIRFSGTSGRVNFITPIAPNGGTGYFALEDSLGRAMACTSVINNGLSGPSGAGTIDIDAAFTPNSGYTLAQAAGLCGFTDFDWQQTITELPLPNPFLQKVSNVQQSAPPPFRDPPPGGYTLLPPPAPFPPYPQPAPDFSYPFYYDPTNGELQNHEIGGNTLLFHDEPADPCLVGGIGCPGTAPAGSRMAFTTHLVGLKGDLAYTDLGIGFKWTSTYNGLSGGITVATKNDIHSSTVTGTGGIAIVDVQTQTTYHPITITGINGVVLDGLCTGVCQPLDQCHDTGICDPATGVCSNPPKAMLAPCDDGNDCTDPDSCDGNGNCVGSSPVGAGTSCFSNSNDCTDAVCDGAGKCIASSAVAAGTPCFTNSNDCTDAVCDGSGNCVASSPVAAGTPCGTAGPACLQQACDGNGQCVGSGPVNCDDLDNCTADICLSPNAQCVHIRTPKALDASGLGRGCIPPGKDVGKCEGKLAKALAILHVNLIKCHRKAADAGLGQKTFDEPGCEAAAQAKYSTQADKVTGCEGCVSRPAIAAELLDDVDSQTTPWLYCAGDTPAPSGNGDIIPPDKPTAKCEDGAGVAVVKLRVALVKCHQKLADARVKGASFPEGECQRTALVKFKTAVGKLTGCPICLTESLPSLAGTTVGALEHLNSQIYCASPNGAFVGSETL